VEDLRDGLNPASAFLSRKGQWCDISVTLVMLALRRSDAGERSLTMRLCRRISTQ
jgi:hypothetical protein